MRDFQLPREQREAFIRQDRARAVFMVADNRMADAGELGADLVMAPRAQRDFDETQAVAPVAHDIAQFGVLRVFKRRGGDFDAPVRRAALDVMQQPAGRRCDVALNHGQVRFMRRPVPKLRGQAAGGFRGFRKQHHARHRAIQAMHHADKRAARLLIFLNQPLPRDV